MSIHGTILGLSFRGCESLLKFWRKPISARETSVEIIHTWLCQDVRAEPNRNLIDLGGGCYGETMKRNDFECLATMYYRKKSHDYGLILFGSPGVSPQNNAELISKQIPKDLKKFQMEGLISSEVLTRYGRMSVVESLALHRSENLVDFFSCWDPIAFLKNKYKTISITREQKIELIVTISEVAQATIQNVTEKISVDVTEEFRDRMMKAWGDDRKALLIKKLSEAKRKAEKYQPWGVDIFQETQGGDRGQAGAGT